MTTLLALAGVLVGCVALGTLFRPRYGAYHGNVGVALEAVERERETEKSTQPTR